MATWPSELPQYPLVEGYNRTPQSSLLQFNTDTGRAKERNRATAMPEQITENYVIEDNLYSVLDSFFKNDAGRGTIPFFKTEPETGLTKEYRFRSPPKFEKRGTLYKVTCELELLP
jgi:hypothetical protein